MVADTLERLADSDEQLGMLTVTAVDTDPDLRHAVVYLASLSDAAAEALAGERAELQRAIGRQVRLKRTPLLRFAVDPGVAHGSHVEEILRQLHEQGELGDDDSGDADGVDDSSDDGDDGGHSRSDDDGETPRTG